ncbi:MAG: SusC/RagA family TonB-linked outer membrane protein [Odoribacteraceae bacterium]|jgi:TonB-linked SusC/RagA family outer membrane protein|nr:SusC/RagA family TonB-linked outer membrane protein [Odoribacteraceae bacterium]
MEPVQATSTCGVNEEQAVQTVKEVFNYIERNSHLVIMYSKNLLSELEKKIFIRLDGKNAEEILKELSTMAGLEYKINDRQVIVAKKRVEQPQDERIKATGQVIDENGESIPGATVTVKGQPGKGTLTDINGNFTLEVPKNAVIVVSFTGYTRVEVPVTNANKLLIRLAVEVKALEEVVVVGFGKQKKASVVGAIQSIRPSELQMSSSTLSSAFAGKLAGVVSVQRSGEPGADGADFWIRGISTFGGGSTPLIFIDGVEVSTGDLNALPPEVIENFSILKDAAATALYGSRGASGVMLVTTRQGKASERAKVNVRVEGQMTQPTQVIDLADGVTYMRLFNEAILTRSPNTPLANLPFSQSKIEHTAAGGDPLIYPNVDWQKMLFKEASYNQTVNLNVTGGGSKVTYFLNATFNNDNGMLRSDPQNKFDNNIRQQRYSIQGNIVADITSTTKVAVRLNTQVLNYGGSRISSATLYSELFNSPGVLFPAYFPDMDGDRIRFGNKYGGPHPQDGNTPLYHNPYAEMVGGYSERNENTNIASFDVVQNLAAVTPGLSVKGLISFKNWTRTSITRYFQPTYYQVDPDKLAADPDMTYSPEILSKNLNPGRNALYTDPTSTGDRLMNLQFSADYARTFDEHDVSALLVYLQRDYHNNAPGDFRDALPTRYQGLSGRVTYGYDGRYLAEINVGYTGSENFESGNRYGIFPAVALGYNISRETFWEPLQEIVSNLKLRGSYGIVGNSVIGGSRFPYLTEVNLTGRSFQFGPVDARVSKSGASITKFGAAGAHWEKGKKLNIGIDLELFNSLSITADIYRENRDGIFMQYRTIPTESGIVGNIPYANIGKVRNEGFDIALDYNKAFLNNELIVSLRGSFTYAKNTLVDRDEPPYDEYNKHQSELNKPLNCSKGYVADGLYAEADFDRDAYGNYTLKASLPASDFNVLPGDIKYRDLNGDNHLDGNDRTLIGNPTVPQIVYGIGASASYKGFDASLFFQGVANTSLMMNDLHPFGAQYTQLYKFIADDFWSEGNPNPDAAYPRLVSGVADHNNFQNSTYWLRDASFLRLKSAEVGYTYQFARVYMEGRNLLTFSKFKNWDPEIGGGRGLSYPPLRTVAVGLQLTF